MTDSFGERIAQAIHEPLLVLDEALRVRRANPSFYRVFDVSEDEILGTSLFDLGDGQWRVQGLREELDAVIREDATIEGFEVDRKFPGLGRRVMLLNARTLVRRDGDLRQILLAIDDVTDQRKLEMELPRHARELRQRARELERSNAELEQFAYAASHDLQEPLRMVVSYLELLERRYGEELADEAREFMAYAVDGARRMQALIDGLLAYARVGRKEGSLGEVALDAVWEDVQADLSGRIRETGAELEAGRLPVVYGNPDQFRHVLMNLVENALTYSGDGPPRVRVTGEERSDGSVRIAVADRGPGVPEGMEEKVFQIFHQLDPHGAGREGAGMGLALCRKIVERHGGEIGVSPTPGGGATFHFTLNLEPENAR